MFCSKCGTENLESASFCSKCGESINSINVSLKKKRNNMVWISALAGFIVLLCCVAPVVYTTSKIVTFGPIPTSTPAPTINMTIYDIGYIENFKIIYRGGFVTNFADLKIMNSWDRPDIKDGESLITVAFEIDNISKKISDSDMSSLPILISPNKNIYERSYQYSFYSFCETNKAGLNFAQDSVSLKNILPGSSGKYVAGFVIGQKELEESESDWILEIPLTTIIKISIPKDSLYPQTTNKYFFEAGIKIFEGKINQNSVVGTPQP